MRFSTLISHLVPAAVALSVSLPAAAQSWTSSTLSIGRLDHGTAALPNGDVLVVGGYMDMTTESAEVVERYSTSTGAWSVDGTTQGDYHFMEVSVFSLPDGRLLAASMEEVMETYDPGAGVWTAHPAAFFFLSSSAVTQLANGDPFFVGGGMEFNDWGTTARFDVATDTLQTLTSLNTPRRGHTATLLADGRVLVTGGYYDDAGYLDSCEIYDPVANTWTFVAPMPGARFNHGAARLPDGRVLVTGGRFSGDTSTSLYDPSTDSWTAGPSMLTARWKHAVVTLSSGRLVVVGGGANVELFDPATETFIPLPSLSTPRGKNATYIPGKGLLVVSNDSSDFYALHQTAEGDPCVITEECASGTCDEGICVDESSGAGAGGPGGPPGGGGGCWLPFFDFSGAPGGAAVLLFAPGLFAWRRRRSEVGRRPQR
ncbi:uncharacterized protein CMC5_054540 [Chondromyces crocatus]|uniref:Kelch domain-containing protein n=2 Tax=Chondromyces crocatus TaxID=52 RepID=A0A0K1EKV6_CHOCO|nr:uncharacterized protein CMC5_054540 [Chondromyces crocatus]